MLQNMWLSQLLNKVKNKRDLEFSCCYCSYSNRMIKMMLRITECVTYLQKITSIKWVYLVLSYNYLQICMRKIYITKSIHWQSQERVQAEQSQELYYFYTEYRNRKWMGWLYKWAQYFGQNEIHMIKLNIIQVDLLTS